MTFYPLFYIYLLLLFGFLEITDPSGKQEISLAKRSEENKCLCKQEVQFKTLDHWNVF